MLWVLIKQIHLCEFLFHYEAFAFQLSGCRCCGFKTFSIQTYLFFYLSISLSVCLSVCVGLSHSNSLSVSLFHLYAWTSYNSSCPILFDQNRHATAISIGTTCPGSGKGVFLCVFPKFSTLSFSLFPESEIKC